MNKRTDRKGRKLKLGEYERKDGRYEYRYDSIITEKPEVTYADTLVKLREKERVIAEKEEHEIDLAPEIRGMTLNELFDTYVEIRKLADTTHENYKRMWDSLVRNDVGKELISDIKPSTLKVFYSKLSKKKYAKATIKYIHELITPTFELAIDDEMLSNNPAKRVKCGGYGEDPVERTALTIQQQENLLEFIDNSKVYNVYGPMVRIQLGTGVRAGELLGLTRDDIDLDKGIIKIDHQLIYKNRGGKGTEFKIAPPKTRAGKRNIPITHEVRQAINKQYQYNMMLGIGKTYEVDGHRGFLFNSKTGRPMQLSAYNCVLKNIVNKYNAIETARAKYEHRKPDLMPRITSHILRHTGCTRMAEQGISIKILQYIMGHENVAVTLQVYTHISDPNMVATELEKADPLKVAR